MEARYGSVGHLEVLEKLQDSQFASAAPVFEGCLGLFGAVWEFLVVTVGLDTSG